jgi:hypothetical protein
MSSCVCVKIPHTPCKSQEGSTGLVAQKQSHTTADECWLIQLRAEGDGPPLAIRVRRLLKAALRRYGLRAVPVKGVNNGG